MIRLRACVVAAIAVGSLSVLPATAQHLAFEVRGGLSVPVSGFGAGDHPAFGDAPGTGGTVMVHVPVHERVGLAVGFSGHRFGCETECSLSSSGVEAGVSVTPAVGLPFQPWVEGGFLTHRFRLRHEPESETAALWVVSRTDPGLYGGAGLLIPLGRHIRLVPAVRYSWFGVQTQEQLANLQPGRQADHDIGLLHVSLGLRFLP
jgi:hypothetical protein